MAAIAEKLTPAAVAMGAPSCLGLRKADFIPHGGRHTQFATRLAEVLADHNEDLLAAYVADERAVGYGRLRRELAIQTGRGEVYPVYFGSAMTGAGLTAFSEGIRDLLPAAHGDPDAPPRGTVFKVERGPAGEKVAYVRMFAGTLRARDRVAFGHGTRRPRPGKVTAISVFELGRAVSRESVRAGQIGKLSGLAAIQIGDAIGSPGPDGTSANGTALNDSGHNAHHFAPPTLETVVTPRHRTDRGALHVALTQLAEQDPLINLREDEERQEMLVSLYGEVQKEVLQATLADDYGIEVGFGGGVTICIERRAGVLVTGRYQPVTRTGPVPARARSDHNPVNRKEYLLSVQRGVVRR
jgi:ribosomal protection tetracycline resistance protein